MLKAQQGQFEVETISRCLAPCDTCSGRYINMMLVKRLVCSCECHLRRKQTHGQAQFGCEKIGTEERKDGLRSAQTVGSPQKRLAVVTPKSTAGEDTGGR